ncbi:MAG: Na+/H+ antiporter subunit E [Spirochaetes bacterium]|nr:Na+/H+ antiporter subunit E [Spirochaetota bacterium]
MRYIVFFLICMVVWVAFTFNLSLQYISIGAVFSLITTIFFGKNFVPGWKKFLNPVRYFWAIIYIPIFLWECIKANFDVAYRVIHPRLLINPGIVKVKTKIKTDIGKVILANSITMTPGTLTIDLIGDTLYIHWIYISSKNPAIYSEKIAGRFEKYIKRIFD